MRGVSPTKPANLLESLPHDHLFLETDSMPDISIIDVYETVAGLIEIEIPELRRQMNSNARTFFGI